MVYDPTVYKGQTKSIFDDPEQERKLKESLLKAQKGTTQESKKIVPQLKLAGGEKLSAAGKFLQDPAATTSQPKLPNAGSLASTGANGTGQGAVVGDEFKFAGTDVSTTVPATAQGVVPGLQHGATNSATGQRWHADKRAWIDNNVFQGLYAGDEFATQGGTGMAPPLAGHDTLGTTMAGQTEESLTLFQTPQFMETQTSWTPELQAKVMEQLSVGIKDSGLNLKSLTDSFAKTGAITYQDKQNLDKTIKNLDRAMMRKPGEQYKVENYPTTEERKELIHSYLKEQGLSAEVLAKSDVFKDFTPASDSTLTPKQVMKDSALTPSTVPSANTAISSGMQAASVSNYSNIASSMQNALNMDMNTDAGRQALLNAISQPVVVPTGWAWDSATSTLSEGLDLGAEGAAPPARAGMSPAQQAAITQALMMQDVARSVYDKAITEDIGMQPVEAGIASQEGMQTERIASSEKMASADLAMQRIITTARESGELLRQRERIQAEATQQGRVLDDRQLDREAQEAVVAMQTGSAESIAQLQSTTQVGLEDRRVALEDRKIVAQTEQERLDRILDERELTLDEQQSLRNLRVQMRELDVAEGRLAGEERMATERAGTTTEQIEAEERMATERVGSQEGMQTAELDAEAAAQRRGISSQETMQTREQEFQKGQQTQRIGLEGAAATGQIRTQAEEQRATYESQLETQQRIAGEERAALAIATSPEGLTTAKNTASTYTTTLNTALKNAAGGDFSGVETALASSLPPTPPGIQWDAQGGGFIQRSGFEGREMDAATQQWIANVTPAFKARARAEQATTHARTLEIERQTQQRAKQQADEDFREAMLTGQIDSAEEAIARQKIAETAQIQNETKLQNMQMLFSMLQNPVQLHMARKHGLLGQIEAVLGFAMSPSAMPTDTLPGYIPNPNEWQTTDNDKKQTMAADWVDNGGSLDDFMAQVQGAAPAQMRTTQYATL